MKFSVAFLLPFAILFVESNGQMVNSPVNSGAQNLPGPPPTAMESCGGATFYQDITTKKKLDCDKKEEVALAKLIADKSQCLTTAERKIKTFEDVKVNCTNKRRVALEKCGSTLQSLQSQRETCVRNCPKRPAAGLPVPASVPLVHLPTGSYFISNHLENWYIADFSCKSNGMELASIETKREDDALRAMLGSGANTRNIHFWISGTDLGSEGKFYWAGNGKPLQYTGFAPDQPDNWNNGENCLLFWKRQDDQPYQWNDGPCDSHKARFICEVEKVR